MRFKGFPIAWFQQKYDTIMSLVSTDEKNLEHAHRWPHPREIWDDEFGGDTTGILICRLSWV